MTVSEVDFTMMGMNQTEIEFHNKGAKMEEVEKAAYVLRFIQTGMRVLCARVMMMVSLVLTFGLFMYAMVNPDGLRFGMAGAFAVLVFMPTVYLDYRDKQNGV
jgi:hypothetical protein